MQELKTIEGPKHSKTGRNTQLLIVKTVHIYGFCKVIPSPIIIYIAIYTNNLVDANIKKRSN